MATKNSINRRSVETGKPSTSDPATFTTEA